MMLRNCFLLNNSRLKLINQLFRSFESKSSTIFALSTNIKSSGSAIAVIRVSGTETLNVIDLITNGQSYLNRQNPRKCFLHKYYDPNTKELIDYGMTLWFPKPKSYTGEDVCEFHIHGSPAIISKMLSVLGEIKDCRPATEGEFTKRALLNGKLKMVQAEGIRDLINAKTDHQRRRALSGVSGTLDNKFDEWRNQIIKVMAHLEAFIDFSEEELIGPEALVDYEKSINSIMEQINNHLKDNKLKSDLIKDGFHVAIIGQANVGKSSLINKLSEKDVSIISPISGTTRDVVEHWINLNGHCVCLADTAGIKDYSNDQVEQQGIKKAIQRAQECHLIITVLDAQDILSKKKISFPKYLQEIINNKSSDECIFIVNKIDLLTSHEELDRIICNSSIPITNPIKLSCLNNEGFVDFLEILKSKIESSCGGNLNDNMEIPFSNERHVVHLTKTVEQLELSRNTLNKDVAICSFHLRQASYYLGCLTGNITTEDILDVIFKDFCIGK